MASRGEARRRSKRPAGEEEEERPVASRNWRHWVSVRGWDGEKVARAVAPPDSRMAAWKGAVDGSV